MSTQRTSIKSLKFWQKIFANTLASGAKEDDSEETRLHKLIMVITSVAISFAGTIWGIIYILFGELGSGLIPLIYTLITFSCIIVFRFYNIYQFFHFSQVLMILVLPYALMLSLGGFVSGSVVIVWGFFAPIVALLSGRVKAAIYWFLGFIVLVLSGGILQPYLNTENNLPNPVKIIFFVINIGTVALVIFLVLRNFVTKKDSMIDLMRKNRKLEKSYLQQEVALRENEKLATLGRLSAGMAHELNNPAAASLRGAKQLKVYISKIEDSLFLFGRLEFKNNQLEIIHSLYKQLCSDTREQFEIDPLERSDRENDMENRLEEKEIENAWSVASMLVGLNFGEPELEVLLENFGKKQLESVITTLHSIYMTNDLLQEIGHGTGRISEIVKSLKSYSHMDQAPIQQINVHEGLNDTLVMLGSQLKKGITVKKKFDEKLPMIEAYGGELNQVWTNIIDNAIGAMNGKGKLKIKTFKEDKWLVVQIINNGPEIPKEFVGKIFDPFYTTKAPGEGTGLGLNISHNIIVQKHHGKIEVFSGEKETCFQINLPLET